MAVVPTEGQDLFGVVVVVFVVVVLVLSPVVHLRDAVSIQ